MRIKLDDTRFGKADLDTQARAAVAVALNEGMNGPWSVKEDGTVSAPGFSLAVSRNGGAPALEADATAIAFHVGKPLTWDVQTVVVQGNAVRIETFRYLVGDQRSIPGLRYQILEKLERITELEGRIRNLEAEVTRLVEVAATQQEEHRAELTTTRELLAATQEKLRDARRKLAGIPVNPGA